MIFLDELHSMKLYKRTFIPPVNSSNKRIGSALLLLSPTLDWSIKLLNTKNLMNTKNYFKALYIERNAVYYINQEGSIDGIDDYIRAPQCIKEGASIDGTGIRSNIDGRNVWVPFNEANAAYSAKMKKLMYEDRIRTSKDLSNLYKQVKAQCPMISRTAIDLNRYQKNNIIIDYSYYSAIFAKNNIYKLQRGIEFYGEMVSRLINDSRIAEAGYGQKTLVLDYFAWKSIYNDKTTTSEDIINWRHNFINPFSLIYYCIFTKKFDLLNSIFDNMDEIVILGKDGYFKLDIKNIDNKTASKYRYLLNKIDVNDLSEATPELGEDSPKVIAANIVEKIEKKTSVDLPAFATPKNLTGNKTLEIKPTPTTPSKAVIATTKATVKKVTADEAKKKEQEEDKTKIIDAINKAAAISTSEDDALEKLDQDQEIDFKALLDKLEEDDGPVRISAARASRISAAQKEFEKKKIDKKTVKDLLEETQEDKPLKETALPIDSINDEWKHITFNNFEKEYDVNSDIVAILNFLSTRSIPVSVIDIDVQDTSTSEDNIYTYTVNLEDANGKRNKLIFDIPKLKNNRFMKLRGNDKTINGQLILIPIIKTDEDTVQMVSNYNKVFIRRYGVATGKSHVCIDRVIKALSKYEGTDIKADYSDSSRVCSKYEVPFEYLDMSTAISKIEFKDTKTTVYMNQDEIREKFAGKIDLSKGFPVAECSGDIIYLTQNLTFHDFILNNVKSNVKFMEIYQGTNPSTKYCYSKASILNTDIPVIILMGYSKGLVKALDAAGIKYSFDEKKAVTKADSSYDYIRFKNGYLNYENTVEASMLLNGLKECSTIDYEVGQVNSKAMWLDFLDGFGGRIKADGLDNFEDLFLDPITLRNCKKYKLPENYIDLLSYANLLLADNKYNKHVDISGNRYRTNELIAGYFYRVLSVSYGQYRNQIKRSRSGVSLTMKRSAVIDAMLLDPTMSDLSKMTPNLEKESSNSLSFKGLSGMNSDRSYGIDKRTFDETMLNKIALSTGFAANVGLTRQATIDMDIDSNRGYIKKKADPKDLSVTKTLSITEALTPFGTTRDDPFRSAMTFIQTSKHQMRTKIATPLLVTNGADEALPYLTSDTFSWKAKGKGKIVEKTDEYMVISYDDGKPNEFVDLRDKIEKNSDGGFYITIKLDTDKKLGDTVKEGEIVAYDKTSYSPVVGPKDNIAANVGILAKIAILNSDEGFEDSAMITPYLSDALASDIVVKIERVIPKNTNIYSLIKKGAVVQEGDPLIIYQNAYDDADANALLKNLTSTEDSEDAISDLGRISVKAKYTGVIEDVKIYRTCEFEEMSPSLQKIVKDNDVNIRKYTKVMDKYKTEDRQAYDADYKLSPTGKLKDTYDAVKIEFYLKYTDKMSVGDKIVYYSALKGVIKYIPPRGQEPTSSYRPNEKLSAFLAANSVNARMVTSILNLGSINKGLIELDRQVKEIMGVEWKPLDKMFPAED